MQVKCSLCGGINEIYPGERIFRCEYCGNSLSIEGDMGPEHLVILHKRDDEKAKSAAVSFVMEKTKRMITCTESSLHFVPFVVKGNGSSGALESATSKEPFKGLRIIQPAGRFAFFEDAIGSIGGTDSTGGPSKYNEAKPTNETEPTEGTAYGVSTQPAMHHIPAKGADEIVPFDGTIDGALRIIHIPIYLVSYKCGNWNGEAFVVGESWQVIAEDLPSAREKEFDTSKLLIPASLFVLFVAIGFVAGSFLTRALIIIGASGISYLLLALKQRLNDS